VTEIGAAYDAGAAAWADGPTRVYGRLADRLVTFSPFPLRDRRVLDLGSGPGAGSRAALAAGARVVAVDLAFGMLQRERDIRPPAAVGDIEHLPFVASGFDVVLAPFSLNHLPDPATGVREAARIAPTLVASTYAEGDDHPVKAAADAALGEEGWVSPPWYAGVKSAMAGWGTVELARAALERGGMQPVAVELLDIALPELGPAEMVAWRLGLAHSAPFFEQLDPAAQRRVSDRAIDLLGPEPAPVVRRVIFVAATT
jgi:SAM-dependent methyltransferase